MADQAASNKIALPLVDKDLASCYRCHRILCRDQFKRDGCPVCNTGALDREQLATETTVRYSGHVGIVDSRGSWVARLIGCRGAAPGVYAARVAKPPTEEE
jgi:RNA polymerase subunit RPABC4/transcription elongation factor Spt4